MTTAPTPSLANLFHQIIWYLPGQAVRLVAGAMLIPVYAVTLPSAELGRLTLIQVGWVLLRIVATAGIPSGQFRLLAECRGDGRHAEGDDVVVTGLISQAALLAVAAAVIWVVATGLDGAGVTEGWTTLLLIMGLGPLLMVPREVAESELRASGRARTWSALSGAQQLVSSGAVALVLFTGPRTAEAVLLVQLVALAVFSVVGPALVWSTRAGRWSTPVLRRMLRFGVATLPALLSDWVLQFADRFMLGALGSLRDVGLYALAWRVGQVSETLVTQATHSAWQPYLLQRYSRPGGDVAIATAATYLVLGVMAFIVPLGAIAAPLFELIHAGEYLPVAPIVFLVALSYWMSLLRHLLLAPTATHFLPQRSIPVWAVGAVSNVALNLVLIPPYGFRGAIIATLVSYAITLPHAVIVSRRIWRIPFEWHRLGAVTVAGVAAGLAASQLSLGLAPIGAFFAQPLFGLAVFVILLVLLRFPRPEEWRMLRQVFR